jgi:hypothetical protein
MTLLLAGAVQAGQLKIRAERNYEYALRIVTIAEGRSDAVARHPLLLRAAPVLRQAELWSKFAAQKGEDVAMLRQRLAELHLRIAKARRSFVGPIDRQPVVPNTGTVIIVAREPEVEVSGSAANRERRARRDELNSWRVRRTLRRTGTHAIEKEQTRLTRWQRLRKEDLAGPKNIERLARRAQLNAWRLTRVESRCPIR